MFFYQGQSCPVCAHRFGLADDIVACPVCGAPHHRECWQHGGRCHFDALHGTPEQWKRDRPEQIDVSPDNAPPDNTPPAGDCPHCGYYNPTFAEICARCGKALPEKDWAAPSADDNQPENPPPWSGWGPSGPGQSAGGYHEYRPFRMPDFDRCGGVPKDETIDGETAGDLAAVVGPNSHYYLPRFSRLDRERRGGWNCAAMLLTPYWLFYRKQYLAGGIALSLWLALLGIRNLLLDQMIAVLGENSFEQLAAALTSGSFGNLPLLLGLVTLAQLLIMVAFGKSGNYLYMRLCTKRVRRLREADPAGYRAALPTAGGISFALAMAAYMAVQFAAFWL